MAEAETAAAAAAEEKELPLVLLLKPLPQFFDEALSKKFRFLKPWDDSSVPTHLFLTRHTESARVMVCTPNDSIDSATLDCLPHLRCIVSTSTGVNHIDMAECRRRGISVGNVGIAFSEDVADYAVGLLLDVLLRISASDRYVRRGLWPLQGEYRPLGSKIRGKQVGIVGLGSIGMEIAKRLEAFGCRIVYNSRRRKPSVSFPYFPNVCDLAAESDVIIVSCALTDETHHIINKDALSALGKDGVVINIGRGQLIDENELVKCLVQGEVGGAGLDVFENEPHVPQELFVMDNVVLSPHSAVLTPEAFSSLLQIIIDNLDAFFSGKPLLYPVE
ncbi:glyoxylate/hydroxypyruvate reductase HPR3-like [Magnolia sinica]|uniref:glyoxylate/hydroxypyruvate reductase HPR3-like n=1 Tax=Magnolia sinica TaxID=86752 RepID=UPI00265867DD|nr:glyoxylate/hydroxypyruvate reductase HPR3-like [Magnolia sinica]